jgi:hypothetical protein
LDRSNRLVASSLVVGVVVALVVLGLTYTPPPNASANACEPGQTVVVQNATATPLLLVNSPYNTPYGDFSTGSVPIENNSKTLTLSAWNGSVWGFFERTDWTVKVGKSVSGSNLACNLNSGEMSHLQA